MGSKGGEIELVPLYYKDERVKIGVLIVVALVIQGIVFGAIYFTSINKINKNIIKQNEAIIGTVEKVDSELARDIVPIITDNKFNNYEAGQRILSDYSYDNRLNVIENPLIGTIGNSIILWVIIFTLLISIVLVFGIFILLNPLYRQIKILTSRAENIVENKFTIEEDENYSGSLDKFILKFSLMEERIINNIDLLQYEKVNLKNIIDDISHQLKTPLMALQMYNEILQDYKNMDTDEVGNFINLSNEQLTRMEWLVKTLLKFARLESNVVKYNKELVSLNNTIEESINPLLIKATEKNQQLIFNNYGELLFNHDRKWISEALSNIIKNAIEHTDENGKIEILLDESAFSITIAIKDNGEGIEKKQFKKIFTRFHKGKNSINPTSIGIGLCLSKAIVKAHNGDITVKSEVGIGSTFFVTFIKDII